MTEPRAPTVVVAVHPPLLVTALSRVLARGHEHDDLEVQVVDLATRPDPEAVHVLRLPDTVGDPAVLTSPGGSVHLVLATLDDVRGLVEDLLRRD